MRSLLVAAFVGVALQASCTSQDDCTVSGAGCRLAPPLLTITPTSLSLAVGDTASVAVVAQRDGRPVTLDVRWTLGQPAVAALDTATVAQARVRLRATVPGTGYLGLLVMVDGQAYNASVPVSVR